MKRARFDFWTEIVHPGAVAMGVARCHGAYDRVGRREEPAVGLLAVVRE